MRSLLAVLFVFFYTNLCSSTIDLSNDSDSILLQSFYLIDHQNRTFSEISSSDDFVQSEQNHLNLGFVRDKSVWVKLTFHNPLAQKLQKVLEVRNPLLEKVTFYDQNIIYTTGMVHKKETDMFLHSAYLLSLDPHSTKTLYIHVENKTTALRFGITLKEKESFFAHEQYQQYIIIVFIGILITQLLLNASLFFYLKNRDFLFYFIYLFTLLAHQLTYLGITPILFPSWFVFVDNLAVVFKVNIMYIAAALFSKSFLQTKKFPTINKIYNILIFIAIVEIPLFGMPSFYYPEVGILTGFVFVLFNFTAGLYIYFHGLKQARFFVYSWSLLVLVFCLAIFDALGLINIVDKYPNIIIYTTVIESILILFAFIDSYKVLQDEKDQLDIDLMQNMKNYQVDLQREISNKTQSLHAALENEKVLRHELHHRIKNNLQLIVSIVRMQADTQSQHLTLDGYKNLEKRIETFAKVHQLLSVNKNLQSICLQEYLEELCEDLQESFSHREIDFAISMAEISLPIKEAGYIGLILNELITNSIKYAQKDSLEIRIEMYKENGYRLCYQDNGRGFIKTQIKQGLGTTIIDTLIKKQLKGSIALDTQDGMNYDIRFTIDEESINS